MDFWRNRFMIDYCQHVIYNLLRRSDGAPFFGTGEKYFSVIDDTEIEIMKCIWEGSEAYSRNPPPRRLWNVKFPELGEPQETGSVSSYYFPKFSYNHKFIKLAENYLQALKELEAEKDKADVLVISDLERAVFFILALQMKNWKKVYFVKGFRRAYESLLSYLLRFPQYYSVYNSNTVIFLNSEYNFELVKDDCIWVFNHSVDLEKLKPIPQNVKKIITYEGRIYPYA